MKVKGSFDMQDAVLAATAEVQRLVMEVVREVSEEDQMKKVRQMWMSMPPEMKEKFKAEKPEEYAAFIRTFND